MTVHVRHCLVHEGGVAHGRLVDEYPVFRLVKIVTDGSLAQHHWFTVFVRKIIRIEKLAGIRIEYIKLSCYKGVIQTQGCWCSKVC